MELPVRVKLGRRLDGYSALLSGAGWPGAERGHSVCGGNARLKPLCRRLETAGDYEFASEDVGAFGTVTDIDEVRNCHDPFDPFALHKAALIACGVIPLEGEESLEDVLTRLGGGIYLSHTGRGSTERFRPGDKQYPFRRGGKSGVPLPWNRERRTGYLRGGFLHGTDHEHRRRLAGSGGRTDAGSEASAYPPGY